MARTDLLTITLNLNAGDSAKQIARELEAAAKAGNAAAAKELEKLRAKEAQAEQRANAVKAKQMEDLVQRRKRLAIEAIKDESQRRRATIEAEYQEERRRIRMLLEERLRAGDISERKMRQQMQQFDVALRAARDRRIADAPGQAVMGNRSRLMSLLGLDGLEMRGAGLGLSGGKALAAGATMAGVAAIGAGLVAATNQAADFQEMMIAVGRTTGMEGAELQALGQDLLDLSAQLGKSQEDVVAIAEAAGSAGIEGRANILAFTKDVIQFSVATGQAADESAEHLAKIENAFGLPVEQTRNLGSAIDALSDTTASNVGDIVKGLREVGAAGRDAGLAAPEVAALVAVLVDAGIDAPTAGNSLKNSIGKFVTEAEKIAPIVGMTEQAWLDLFSKEPLRAMELYLSKLRDMSNVQRKIAIDAAFGEENTLTLTTLATNADKVATSMASANAAFEAGTRIGSSYAQAAESANHQEDLLAANIAKTATEIGQTLLPAYTGLLKGLNSLIGDGETVEETFGRLNDELANTDAAAALAERYDELSAKLKTLEEDSNEHEKTQNDLNGTIAEIGRLFPGVVASYDAMGNASVIHEGQLRNELNTLRQLNQERREEAARNAFGQIVEARDARDRARARAADVSGNAPDIALANRFNPSSYAGTTGGWAAGWALTRVAPSAQELAGASWTIAQDAQQTTQAFADAVDEGAYVMQQMLPSIRDLQKGTEAWDGAIRRTVVLMGEHAQRFGNPDAFAEQVLNRARTLAPAAPAATQGNGNGNGSGTTETGSRTRSNRGGQRSAEAEARRASDAADRLREAAAARAAEQIADEYDRQVDQLRARYAAERKEINDTAEAALKPFKNRRTLTEAENTRRDQILLDQKTAIDALGVIEQREIVDVEKARSKAAEQRRQQAFEEQEQAEAIADERYRMFGQSEASILAMRMQRLTVELAGEQAGSDRQKALLKDKAQLQLAIDREAHERRQRLAQMDREAVAQGRQYELDALSDAHAAALLNIEDERERERVAIEQRQQERRAAAEAAYQTEMERIRDAGMTEVEARAATAAAEIALDQSIEDARRDAARETAEIQRRLEQERLEQMRGYVNQAFDVIVQAGQRERRYTDAQVARERRGFDEQETELRKSLRQRRITTQEFNDQMAELAERRAAFEKDAAADSASFVTDVLIGMVGIAKAAALEIIKAELAKAATTAIFNVQKGGWGKIAAGVGGPVGVAALAAATFAAVWGLEKVIRGAAGFATGGYTGAGGRYDVAGFAHRGEVILESPIVSGQERDWLEIRRLAQSGVPARAFLDAAQVRAAMRPSLPKSTATAAVNAFDDRRLVAATQATNARLDRLSHAVDALANRPVNYVVGDANARLQRYAAEREARRVDPRRRL